MTIHVCRPARNEALDYWRDPIVTEDLDDAMIQAAFYGAPPVWIEGGSGIFIRVLITHDVVAEARETLASTLLGDGEALA